MTLPEPPRPDELDSNEIRAALLAKIKATLADSTELPAEPSITASTALVLCSIAVALCADAVPLLQELRENSTLVSSLSAIAGKLVENSGNILFCCKRLASGAAVTDAYDLLCTALYVFRLAIDLSPSAPKGAAKSVLALLRCKKTAEALTIAKDRLMDYMLVNTLACTNILAGDAIARQEPRADAPDFAPFIGMPAGAEAATFWSENGFCAQVTIVNVLDALYNHAQNEGRLPPEFEDKPSTDNLPLVKYLAGSQDSPVVTVQQFADLIGQAPTICDALDKYFHGSEVGVSDAEAQQRAAGDQSSDSIQADADVARLASGQDTTGGQNVLYTSYTKDLKRIDAWLLTLADGDADVLPLLRRALKRTLAVLLALVEPVTLTEFAALMGAGSGALTEAPQSRATTRALLAALAPLFPEKSPDTGLEPLHKDVFDFLRQGSAADGIEPIDEAEGHALLLGACSQLRGTLSYAANFEAHHGARCAMSAAANANAKRAEEAWLNELDGDRAAEGLRQVSMKLLDLGAYRAAIAYGTRVIAAEPHDAAALVLLGAAKDSQGLYEEALALYEKALTIYQATAGGAHPDTAATYSNIGVVCSSLGKHSRAVAFFQKALAIQRVALGEASPETALTYNNLAIVSHTQGLYDQALEYYGKALTICRPTLGEHHPHVGGMYNNVAAVHWAKGEHNEALECYSKALAIRLQELGSHHPAVAAIYNNMALVYKGRGDADRALEYYGKALSIYQSMVGEQHPETATTYHNMALLYKTLGADDRALVHYAKALAIRRSVLGTTHPATGQTLYNMGVLHGARGEATAAAACFRDAHGSYLATYGAAHNDTVDALAQLEACS